MKTSRKQQRRHGGERAAPANGGGRLPGLTAPPRLPSRMLPNSCSPPAAMAAALAAAAPLERELPIQSAAWATRGTLHDQQPISGRCWCSLDPARLLQGAPSWLPRWQAGEQRRANWRAAPPFPARTVYTDPSERASRRETMAAGAAASARRPAASTLCGSAMIPSQIPPHVDALPHACMQAVERRRRPPPPPPRRLRHAAGALRPGGSTTHLRLKAVFCPPACRRWHSVQGGPAVHPGRAEGAVRLVQTLPPLRHSRAVQSRTAAPGAVCFCFHHGKHCSGSSRQCRTMWRLLQQAWHMWQPPAPAC